MLQPGTLLGNRYKIESLLARGGSSRVYLAALGERRFAVKELLLWPGEDDQSQQRRHFRNEAALLGRLHHSHLVGVTEFIEEGDRLYLVMPFIEGVTLQQLIDKRETFLPVSHVMAWSLQLCGVIEYLHSHKLEKQPVLVRDLKPANLIVDKLGTLNVVDFGLAREINRETTRFLKGAGTTGFAPIEQYGSDATDERTDIYALGATLYYMLTHKVPPASVARLTGDVELVRPSVINISVSPGLEAVVMRMLAVHKNHRFPSAKEAKRSLTMAMKKNGERYLCLQCGSVLVRSVAPCQNCAETAVAPGAEAEPAAALPAKAVTPLSEKVRNALEWWFHFKENLWDAPTVPRNEKKLPSLPKKIEALCTVQAQAFTVFVTDIGVGGMLLQTPQRLKKNDILQIHVPLSAVMTNRKSQEFVKFYVTVEYCRKSAEENFYDTSVTHDEPVNKGRDQWVSLVLEQYGMRLSDRGKRDGERWSVDLPVTLVMPKGGHYRGTVHNICLSGMLARFQYNDVSVQDNISFVLGDINNGEILQLGGTVLRALRTPATSLVGVQFDELDEGKRDLLVERMLTLGQTK